MVEIKIPHNLVDINKVAEILLDSPLYVEINNPVLLRKIGFYMKPLTNQGLLRILPGRNDTLGSALICKSRTVTKITNGHLNRYIFSNEKIRIPQL